MGRVEKKSRTTLSRIFLKYVLVMLSGLLILGTALVMVFHLLVNINCIYPANYAERSIEAISDTLKNTDKVIAEKHGGAVELSNSEASGGARVKISFKV